MGAGPPREAVDTRREIASSRQSHPKDCSDRQAGSGISPPADRSWEAQSRSQEVGGGGPSARSQASARARSTSGAAPHTGGVDDPRLEPAREAG